MNTLMKSFKTSLGLSAVLLALAVPASAQDSNGYTYVQINGNECHPYSQYYAGTYAAGSYLRRPWGFRNDSSSTKPIVCPIIRPADETNYHAPIYIDNATVYSVSSASGNVACSLRATKMIYNSIDYSPALVFSSSNARLTLSAPWSPPSTTTAFIYCEVPPGAHVTGAHVRFRIATSITGGQPI